MLRLHAAPPRQVHQAELPQQHATYQSLYQRLVLARNASKPCPISIRYSFTHQFISCAEIAPEAMGGVAEFKHEPLPDSTTHIRLLKIKSVDAEDRVVCLLTAWPMEEAPEYYALSYVLRMHTCGALYTDWPFLFTDIPGAHLPQVIKFSSMDASSRRVRIAFMRSNRRMQRRRMGISGWMLFALTRALHKKRTIKWE